MFGFYKKYFVLFLLLFAVEFIIGAYFHDPLIRPYGGDFLVVILLYCLVKSFMNSHVLETAAGVLLFSYIVEVSQYFHLINILGLQHSKTARIILGTSFSFTDLMAYSLGISLVIVLEHMKINRIGFKRT